MDMDFVCTCTFELEYGRMVDFSRLIITEGPIYLYTIINTLLFCTVQQN